VAATQGENRASGAIIKGADVNLPGEKKKPLADAFEEKKTKKQAGPEGPLSPNQEYTTEVRLLLVARLRGRRRDPRSIADPAHGLGAPRESQLRENVMDVMLDCRHAQREFMPDLLVREAAAEQLEDLNLPPGQRLFEAGVIGPRIPVKQRAQETARDLGRTRQTAGNDVSERLAERIDRRAARHVAGESCAPASHDVLPLFVEAERDHCDTRPSDGDGTYLEEIDALRDIDERHVSGGRCQHVAELREVRDDSRDAHAGPAPEARDQAIR